MNSFELSEYLENAQLEDSRVIAEELRGYFYNEKIDDVSFFNSQFSRLAPTYWMYNKADDTDILVVNDGYINYKDAETALKYPEYSVFVTSMKKLFVDYKADTLDLSLLNTSNVVEMYGMFKGAKINKLNLNRIDTGNVFTMKDMFNGFRSNNLNLGHLNVSEVTNMVGMFEGSRLQTLNINGWDTQNLLSVFRMFKNSKIGSVDMHEFKTVKVEDMVDMFHGCETPLLDIQNFTTQNLHDISFFDNIFTNCTAKIVVRSNSRLDFIKKTLHNK